MTPARTRSARWLLCAFALVVLSGLAMGSASAQPNTGKVTFTTGVDFTNMYFFRGIRQDVRASSLSPMQISILTCTPTMMAPASTE